MFKVNLFFIQLYLTSNQVTKDKLGVFTPFFVVKSLLVNSFVYICININNLQMSIKERLLTILKMHNLTPSEFADKIGVQRSNISHVLSGRNKPSLDFLEKVVLNFPRVNAHWLLTGTIIENKQDRVSQEKAQDTQVANNDGINTFDNDQIDRIVVFLKDGTFSSYRPKY